MIKDWNKMENLWDTGRVVFLKLSHGYTFYILCTFPNCYIHNKRRKNLEYRVIFKVKYHLWPRQYTKHFFQIATWIQKISKCQGFLSESDEL